MCIRDRIRDQLKEMADTEGVTVSEYVRDLLMAAIVPVYEREVDPVSYTHLDVYKRQILQGVHRTLLIPGVAPHSIHQTEMGPR